MHVGRRVFGWTGVVLLLGCLACGDGTDTGDPLVADPAVAPFVGDWEATALTLTSTANPEIIADLIALGATFTLNVQPSSQYTAILVYLGQASTEIGSLSVSGSTLTLHRDFPTTAVTPGTFEFFGPDRLTLDGDSDFDFNLDGSAEAALSHLDLIRR